MDADVGRREALAFNAWLAELKQRKGFKQVFVILGNHELNLYKL